MKKKKFVALALAFALSLSLVACGNKPEDPETPEDPATSGGSWPTGQVEIVVPAAAGGSQDVRARVVADYLQRKYGVTVVVNNMGEGNGVTGFEYVRNAKPDGSVLLYNYTGNIASMYHVGKYAHHPADAFTTIAQTEFWGGTVLVAPANSPYDTFADMVNDLKATGGSVTVGAQLGSLNQSRLTVFAKNEGVNFEMVEAMTATDKVTAMAGGFVDMTFLPVATAAQYEESGDLKILGVTGVARDPLFPDYSTIVEQGGYDLDLNGYSRVYAPAGMDPELAAAINEAICGIQDDPTAVEGMKNLGSTFIDGISLVDWETAVKLLEEDNQSVKVAVEAAGFLVQ